MTQTDFRVLLDIKRDKLVRIDGDQGVLAVCPDMGGRVFAEVCGRSVHRIDLETVLNPNQPFNMFGGNTLWPAPEGGKFGFNYNRDGEWYVPEAVNFQPFELAHCDADGIDMVKIAELANRAGVQVTARMKRHVSLAEPAGCLSGYHPESVLSYQTIDTLELVNRVSVEDALIGSWSLEQFDATDETISFCAVRSPREAINFDFYDGEHPETRIAYLRNGFTYKTDGKARGQIGIRTQSQAAFIGFCCLSDGLLCLRENLTPPGGLYFNIADNDQPNGPYSASDNYSIFNSDTSMGLFETETIGPAIVSDGLLRGSELISRTTFAVFEDPEQLAGFIATHIG